MSYVVLEIQKYTNGQIGTLVNTYETLNQAYQKYHTILAAAAVSELPTHAAVIISDEGQVINFDSFRNNSEPESEE